MKSFVFLAAAVFAVGAAWAQPMPPDNPPRPTMAPSPTNAETGARPRPHRATGITYELAVEAAETAVAHCAALPKDYRVTALVTDSAAVPIALVTGNDGAAITQRIAMGKSQLVVKYKTASTDAVAKAKSDSAFRDELAANPLIVAARPGGLPIMLNGQFVGTISVSGTPDGHDDECAKAGLDKIQSRLKTF
ncbi:MAG TPA: heme-binding protein [Rhizomicrobium sp.]|nr:heme-binding protein [Rhizomicrobium sp.]